MVKLTGPIYTIREYKRRRQIILNNKVVMRDIMTLLLRSKRLLKQHNAHRLNVELGYIVNVLAKLHGLPTHTVIGELQQMRASLLDDTIYWNGIEKLYNRIVGLCQNLQHQVAKQK
jgi:hypothetical protein